MLLALRLMQRAALMQIHLSEEGRSGPGLQKVPAFAMAHSSAGRHVSQPGVVIAASTGRVGRLQRKGA